jgi:GTP-binding protein HflX
LPRDLIDRRPPEDVAAVVLPVIAGAEVARSRLEESQGLAEALGVKLAFTEQLNVREPHPARLFGSGQLDALAERFKEDGVTLFVVDAALTPVQQRNLELELKLKVVDRTGLILEIFGLRARTAEGRLQVEMARSLYERSRLVRTWTHLERQRGGFGFLGGPGESQLETDRRLLDKRIAGFRRELEDVRRTRRLQREGRARRGAPVAAIVGYTNAGKSTLFNRLTSSDVLAADMPFATLDPTAREIVAASGRRIALVDTVGFITDLPTTLVAAFRATLEEAMEADLLVHVRDISHPDTEYQANDVYGILEQLSEETGLDQPPMIEVWNKADAEWCCWGGLNSRPQPYQGCALPLSYSSTVPDARGGISRRPSRHMTSCGRCGRRSTCSDRCWRGLDTRQCRCRAVARSARGRWTCTSRRSRRWAPISSLRKAM